MLSFPAAVKVYLCTVACDMRRSFDGLSMMAEHVIRCNPFSGHLLVFCNRRSDRLKILYWDRDGWAIKQGCGSRHGGAGLRGVVI
jgi:transposase